MRSSDRARGLAALTVIAAAAVTATARADESAIGFALDRLYLAPPGSRWQTQNDLRMHGGIGAALQVAVDYAHDPFHVPDGRGGRLDVVSDQLATHAVGAITYDRFRFTFGFGIPVYLTGRGGTANHLVYAGPDVNPQNNPDSFSDLHVGVDARLYGEATSALRLGVAVDMYAPSGLHEDYSTDGYYRAMARLLVAGDIGRFAYAGSVGVHVRPSEEAVPNAPRGTELLFGVAGGPRLPFAHQRGELSIGPELFGETAFSDFLGKYTTGVEGLMTARVATTSEEHPVVALKLSGGGGLDAEFGTPAWRTVLSLEVHDLAHRPGENAH